MEYDKIIKETDTCHVKESMSIAIRTYFSIQHIQSGALFAKHAYFIERIIMEFFQTDCFLNIEHMLLVQFYLPFLFLKPQ
jgi:hypothetical protein